jgi:hypothetical protein
VGVDVAREITKLMHDGAPAMRQLTLGTNCFGSRFDDMKTFVEPFDIDVDIGAERFF